MQELAATQRGGGGVGEKDIAQKILEAHNDVFPTL